MNVRHLIAAGVAAAVALPLAAIAVAAPLTGTRPALLVWKDCGDGLRCADLVVPADWADPSGPTTSVHVAKLPARDPARSRGPLVVNFGGPGTSTAMLRPSGDPDYPPELPSLLRELTATFDVVAVDPRGLAEPASGRAVSCSEPGPSPFDLVTARERRDWEAHAARTAAHYASCRKAAKAAWYGLTSWQVAHDLDALRAALGQRTLRYAGNSYGTVHGQAYLELFPRRVGRMYFDGTADHTHADLEPWLVNYARTQERHLTRFRDWCAARRDCALHGEDAGRVWDELVARARRGPLPASGGRTVTEGRLLAGALQGMNPARWPEFATALRKARDGNAAGFLTELAPDAGHSSVTDVMLCNDFMPRPPGYERFQAIEARLRQVAPRFGWIEGRYELGRCWGRPTGAEVPSWAPHPLRVPPGVPPVLFAIGDLDNNTNHLGQAHVAAQVPSARVLRHGDGHASWAGNSCLRRHVNAYLATGALPPPGTHCPAERIHRVGR